MAEEQRLALGCTLLQRMDELIVHGMLHCLGYDHELGADEERAMEQKEDEVLAALDAELVRQRNRYVVLTKERTKRKQAAAQQQQVTEAVDQNKIA